MKELVIISGKGGTGKTSFTAALASLGKNQVLADCDVDAADLHLVLTPSNKKSEIFVAGEMPTIDAELCISCGLCQSHCRFDAISDDFVVRPEMCEGCGVCSFVCPENAVKVKERECGHWYHSETRFGPMIHADLGIGEENSGKLVSTVRKEARTLAEKLGAGMILTDGPPGIGCPVIASLGGADLTVAVTEPTLSAIHDLERLQGLTKHFDIPLMVVINKYDINPDMAERLKTTCAENGIEIAGILPYDQTVTKAQMNTQTIVEHDPEGLGKDIQRIWSCIAKRLGVDTPA